MENKIFESSAFMLGDWVNIGGDLAQYGKITELKQHTIQVCNYWFDRGCVLPIPISSEILNRTKFIKLKRSDEQFFDNAYKLEIDDTGEVIYLTKCSIKNGTNDIIWHFDISGKLYLPIKYIHELQHALKLLNLDKLAENIII